MRYKDVFKIWILADVFIALGLLIYLLITLGRVSELKDLANPGMFILVVMWGLFISVPSLITMLIFHHFYVNKASSNSNYLSTYSIMILIINILYFLIGRTGYFDVIAGLSTFYILSTIAGLSALFCIDWWIRRAKKIKEGSTTINGERSQF